MSTTIRGATEWNWKGLLFGSSHCAATGEFGVSSKGKITTDRGKSLQRTTLDEMGNQKVLMGEIMGWW